MALFLSTFVNKVDRKGRVSVPATFRAALNGQSFNGIACFPSFKHPAIEGMGFDRIEEMTARLDTLDQFSDDFDALSALLGDTQQLPFDGEGRIILPAELASHAGITDSAAFVGLGRTFQIWEPEALRRHQIEMRERARRQGMTLPARTPAAPAAAGAPR